MTGYRQISPVNWPCISEICAVFGFRRRALAALFKSVKGVPDFVIFADAGRVFAIEAKTKRGKLTMEQLGWKMLLGRNGHRYAVVRSFSEFQDVVETWLAH